MAFVTLGCRPARAFLGIRGNIGIEACQIGPRADNFPGLLHHRSIILSALGPNYALTVLFLGTHEQLPNGSPILGVLWPPSRLTSKFLWNPKPVSS
ncbi:hypothetical protein DVH24_003932 [Malus domestica]|uniref:Uncharacterized protein n=1 Tax=Malus domestica TaxID=3750 RepID=A0A498K4U8_MALDO|nr:hypothetical protein DVH24_003932 [Malus domestica]